MVDGKLSLDIPQTHTHSQRSSRSYCKATDRHSTHASISQPHKAVSCLDPSFPSRRQGCQVLHPLEHASVSAKSGTAIKKQHGQGLADSRPSRITSCSIMQKCASQNQQSRYAAL